MKPHALKWVLFTKRTEDPKLKWLEAELKKHGIKSRRNGASWHAPILEVRQKDLGAAWKILDPVDDVPDDDVRFRESKPWWWARRCCDKAQWGPNCVCEFNTICPEHGHQHHGTHD